MSAAVRARPYGRTAILLELDSSEDVAALSAALAANPPVGLVEAVPGARTVLVRFDPSATSDAALQEAAGVALASSSTARGEATSTVVHIDVVYDGADLAAVAAELGVSLEEVITRHSAASYRCAFCGFAPGFSYLVGGDPLLRVPRLAQPRTQVPAGSVAIAGEFSAVYPSASPGGWRLLGRTDAPMWDLARANPALVPPGTAVRFRPVRAAVVTVG